MPHPSDKHIAVANRIANKSTGTPIPDDEPVFVLRARDLLAIDTIKHYANGVRDDAHRSAVRTTLSAFVEFKKRNPGQMKQPD